VGAVFAQDAIAIRSHLLFELGLRYDNYSTFGGTTNPRVDLIYSPFEKTTLKFLYGQSFRAPTAYEMYYAAYPNESNLHLRPETAKTTEVVWEQTLGNNFRLTASGYFYPIRGLISEGAGTAPGLIIYRNFGNVNLQGMEWALNKQLPSGLEVGGSFSYQNARDLSNPTPLTNSPHELGQAHLSLSLAHRKIFASMNAQYVSKRETLAGNYAGGYFLPNLTLFSQKALRGWEVSASLYNIFDKRYGDPGAEEHLEDILYQDGRTFRIKISYHFARE
jgi:iron complex outermembrane receptor protein